METLYRVTGIICVWSAVAAICGIMLYIGWRLVFEVFRKTWLYLWFDYLIFLYNPYYGVDREILAKGFANFLRGYARGSNKNPFGKKISEKIIKIIKNDTELTREFDSTEYMQEILEETIQKLQLSKPTN